MTLYKALRAAYRAFRREWAQQRRNSRIADPFA